MPTQPQSPLTAADLADFRANLVTQRDRATVAGASAVPANLVCRREFNRGLETAYNYALDALDELLADAVTFTLVDPGEGQGA